MEVPISFSHSLVCCLDFNFQPGLEIFLETGVPVNKWNCIAFKLEVLKCAA